MNPLLVVLALLLASANAAETPAECPEGTHRAITDDPYQPFECVKEDVKKGFGAVAGPQGFKARPKCPRGTRAVASTDGLQRYRCVRALAGQTEPDLVPAARSPRSRAPGDEAYRRYTVPGEMSFDYPRLLQPRDDWKEEVPTLSFTLDDGLPGKPVMITITKVEPAQTAFIDLDAAVGKDKEWQSAKDGGSMRVAGVKARLTVVAGESQTAYVPLAAGAYYAIVYSAPVESYGAYLGSFNRLLKTMKLMRRVQ